VARITKPLVVILCTYTLAACQGGDGGDAGSSTLSPPADSNNELNNTQPIADAGVDFSVIENTLVVLDGQNSYDPDGDAFSYRWRQISGPVTTLSSDSEATPSFLAPVAGSNLSYELVVNDNREISVADSVTITVLSTSINRVPTADAGQNQAVNITSLVTLDGSNSSDPDGDPIRYSWTQTRGTAVELSASSMATPWFTAPGIPDTLAFSLTVSDDLETSAPATVIVNIRTAVSNQPPVADAGPDQTVDGNTTVMLNGESSTDADGNALSYRWQQTSGPNVALSSTTSSRPSFTAPAEGGSLGFSLTVNDGLLNSSADNVVIEVNEVTVNRRPTADAGTDQEVDGNISVTLNGANSSDPDGDALSYQWQQTGGPAVVLSSPTQVNPNFISPAAGGILYFSLTVNDGQQNSLTDTLVVTVTEQPSNRRPIADAGADQTVDGNSTVALNGFNSSDPDGDSLSYEWQQTTGEEVILSSLTTANPEFTTPLTEGTLSFSLTVSDGQENSLIDTVTVIVNAVNTIPIANAGVDRYVSSNAVVTLYGANSLDADDDALTYQWQQVSGPVAVLNSTSRANPSFSADVDGRLIFSLVVNDGEADSVADLMTVTVGEIPVTNMKVNGTGITWGANYPAGNNSSCIGETIDQQDCYGGRDISYADDSDGRAGFSYIKIASDGSEMSNDATEWDCVKDQVTGLTWEVKKGGNAIQGDEGLHDADDTFRWYNTDASSNGGANGFDNSGNNSCSGYADGDSSRYCNTQAYVARVNAEGHCGYGNWRMPSRKELLSLVDFGDVAPMIDRNYFPTGGVYVWSGTPLAFGNTSAWGVYFAYGNSFNLDRRNSRRVRLVRSEP